MTDKKNLTPRQLAFKSLMTCEKNGSYSNLEVSNSLDGSGLNGADRGLYTRIVYGVIERKITLDYIISSLAGDREIDSDVRCALRMGIYQMRFMDRVPDFAAVNESVDLVSSKKKSFVNAVLRNYIRKKISLPNRPDDGADIEEYISWFETEYSFPKELIRVYINSYGVETTEGILSSSNLTPEICLRINTLRTDESMAEIAEKLGGRVSVIAGDCVLVPELNKDIRRGIEKGDWFVQDEASRICVETLGAEKGETVIDTCACPGGKTFSVAMDMKNEGKIFAFDIHGNKLSLINKGAKRLGIDIIETGVNDASKPKDELKGTADRVLCDAPCSGLGVTAKKPDIKYKSVASIENLPDIQYGCLCGAAEYVKNGGTVVYSTCTLNKAENEMVVERFVSSHPEFEVETMRTFFPHIDGCDGFFVAKMRKMGKIQKGQDGEN